jgi:hypothetical protein
MANYPVTASNKDGTAGDSHDDTSALLSATQNNDPISPAYNYAWAELDTSAIGTDVISAATLYWYHSSYTKTKAATYGRVITVGASTILNTAATPAAAGWHSEVLTSGELASINKTGDTTVHFQVGNPGSTYFRTWQLRAWDYDGAGGFACYLEITHAPAGGPTRMTIVRA